MAAGMTGKTFYCSHALLPEGWLPDCRITVNDYGVIDLVEQGSRASGDTALAGPVIPGMANVHSHIHQRLIAGLTGYQARGRDSFWTWREQMYRAVGNLSVADLESLAEHAFMELLEGGYTVTGEFHYPHRLGGAEPAETAASLLAAASRAGMVLTLLPVWYQHAGFGRQAPTERQRPFVMTLDDVAALVQQLRHRTADDMHHIGIAPHSLRAVDVSDLPGLLEAIPEGPVHLHISEQIAEVEECRKATGKSPISLLAETVRLDRRWCLIHATHASVAEVELMAKSDVVVGLCPTTEADLGDGLFPVAEFTRDGGRFAIGSDSNLVMSAAEELRLLEWGQRLLWHRRNVLCDEGEHIGTRLWQVAAGSGADALQQPCGQLAAGRRADLVVLASDHSLTAGLTPGQQLDSLIFAGGERMIDRVYVAGRLQVEGGRHVGRRDDDAGDRFARLRQRLSTLS